MDCLTSIDIPNFAKLINELKNMKFAINKLDSTIENLDHKISLLQINSSHFPFPFIYLIGGCEMLRQRHGIAWDVVSVALFWRCSQKRISKY